ncbi:putative ubiquitin family protein [Botrytis fragariae]|uniref:Putative ubiquitin family protein n=1 Tax=Botrytis fragariae TaxID=1964551 RepID=A0A8H6EJ78_9HELO|nr:putative ubiquitin family protein [Botrytis fragariae]KAF5873900.1 putative ubiquitin family protein [Botrytis fragariae]
MSQSPEKNDSGSDTPTKDEEQPKLPTFTLSIVSPSVEVASPLTFPQLLVTTTVQELKAKIREVVQSKPTDSAQRLIHRGRMLERESQTMLEIFGQDSLSSLDTHTLHLVLRPAPPEPTPTRVTDPHTQNNPSNIPPPQISTPPPQFRGQPAAQILHQQHRDFNHATHTQRLQQLQREAERLQQELEAGTRAYQSQIGRLLNLGNNMPTPPTVTRNPYASTNANHTSPIEQLIAQHQRTRRVGPLGAPDTGGQPNMFTALDEMNSGRSTPQPRAPDHSSTYTREGVGPNGERWQVTINETTTTVPAGAFRSPERHNPFRSPERGSYVQQPASPVASTGNPALDLQNYLRNVDRLRAPQAPSAAPRSSSTPPSAQPGTQTPSSTPAPATTSAPSTPLTAMSPNPAASASLPNLTPTPAASTSITSSQSVEPMVYILTSPSGPRALLINNSETFYTPRVSRTRPGNGVGGRDLIGLPEYRNRNAQRARIGRGNRQRANEEVPAADFPPIHNRAQRAGVPVALQLVNVLWLVIRLIGFVWFFTSGNSSWSRFLMMSGLAIVVFLINTGVLTGVFNGIAEQFWGPIRRHLENLIPLAGPDAALVPAVNAAVVPQNGAAEANPTARLPHGQLDESQVAARILEQQRQRQAQPGWLITQIRRAEHAALLFVASLVPGVGERHIAARDNAAREAETAAAEAERRRVEAETAENGTAENGSAENGELGVAEQANDGEHTERAVEDGEAAGETTRPNAEVEREAPPAQPLVV